MIAGPPTTPAPQTQPKNPLPHPGNPNRKASHREPRHRHQYSQSENEPPMRSPLKRWLKTQFNPWMRRYIPRGHPLWYPYELTRKKLAAARGGPRPNPDYVTHENILLAPQKAIFFTVPKVAASSLKSVFAEVLQLPVPAGELIEEIHHVNFPHVKKYQIPRRYADHFRFCFVRNPWDRLVATYKDKVNYGKGHIYERYDNPFIQYLRERGLDHTKMEFADFVAFVAQLPDVDAEGHLRSQHLYTEDEHGRSLVNFVGKMENIGRDFEVIRERLGIRQTVPHLRKNQHKPYWEYYDDKTAAMVNERFRTDIERFRYRFREETSAPVQAVPNGEPVATVSGR